MWRELGRGAQQHRGIDAVVVGDGDQRRQAELLDLAVLQAIGHARLERRTPVRGEEVQLQAGALFALLLVMAHDAADRGDGVAHVVG